VPAALVPMKFPWIVVVEALLVAAMPELLPEMT
jgi:hypothetical protein